MAKAIFVVSSIYLVAVGFALMAFPLQFGWGAVPSDAKPELLAFLRLLGGPFLGIAVLNWLSRNLHPNSLNAVTLANIIGFGAVTANDAWGVISGDAREIAKLFLVVHLTFMLAFLGLFRTRAARMD